MKHFPARLFDGQTAGSRSTTIQIINTKGLRLFDVDSETHFDFSELVVGERLSGQPAVIDLPDGGRVEILEADEFFRTLREHTGRNDWVYWFESRWGWVLAALIITVITVWGGVTYGIPAAAKIAANLMPEEIDDSIGEQALLWMDNGFLSPTDLEADRQAELTVRFTDVVNTVGAGIYSRLEFRRGDRFGANALALPSGIVILTDELVKIAANDDEVAAVLAHEVGHVRHRHTLRAIIQNSVAAGLIVALTGDLGSVANIAASIPTFLLERSYSRDFEREADDIAFEYLDIKGIPGQPLADLLLRIEVHDDFEDDTANLLSTHPRSGERVR